MSNCNDIEPQPSDGAVQDYFAVVELRAFAAIRKRIGYDLAAQTLASVNDKIYETLPSAKIARTGRINVEFSFSAATPRDAEKELERLCDRLDEKTLIGGYSAVLSAVVGATWIDSRPLSDHVYDEAMAALDVIRHGERRIAMFNSEKIERNIYERVSLMADLREAINNDLLQLHYQPKMKARTTTIESSEALLRWDHGDHGILRTDKLIEIAEQTGVERDLTEWVILRALADAETISKTGQDHRVFVNVSGPLLSDPDFAQWLLKNTSGAESRIGIEITETAVISHPELAISHLSQFAAAGIAVAIDDYGTGLSSLAYLKRLPACELKIDQSFISGLIVSHRDPLLVRSTIDLAHALEMEVTAEGVEDRMTLSLLQVMGCDIIQGFAISPALPIADFTAFLAQFDGDQLSGDNADNTGFGITAT